MLHSQSSITPSSDSNAIGLAVKKRAQVASTVLPHVVLVAHDAPEGSANSKGKGQPASSTKAGAQSKVQSPPLQHHQSPASSYIEPNSKLKKRSQSLPDAITMSVDFLLRSGLDVEGVFDTPTENSPKVQTYLRSFHEGLGQLVIFGNVSEAAGCFLAHLATVPEPLLSYELHLCFLVVDDEVIGEEEKIGRCRNLLHTLPANTLALIKYVIDFCAVLVSRCKDRLRGLERMANIMTPILLQRNQDDTEFPAAKNITRLLIKYHLQVFRKSMNTAPTTHSPPLLSPHASHTTAVAANSYVH